MSKNKIVKYIPNRDYYLDPEDTIKLKKFNFTVDSSGYVRCSATPFVNRTLHSILFQLYKVEIPAGKVIDHINDCQFDNRKCNLRLLAVGENVRRGCTLTPILRPRDGKWRVVFHTKYKATTPSFSTKEEAISFAEKKKQEFNLACSQIPTLQEIVDAGNTEAETN